MQAHNTAQHYGSVAKTFHWLTALLILTLIPTGIIANGLPFETSEELARKARLFSVHKTLGVVLFFVALARILWALRQRKPDGLASHNKVEGFAAETVHWLLYGSLVLVPMTGWIHHAATTGFAPIWWPF
ncbi:MAG: cytochrome b/b6 domain-containing protein, partial [Rhodobacteraceae bacterium]|nr:cytochrome b/b6 domain-containing protein [Paracoccaceae bacterium]